MRYLHFCAHEQFPPDELLRQAVEAEHAVERIRQVEEMGATTVALMNNSGADPLAAIGVYRSQVLPKLSRSLAPG